jgi:hypothetical protein
LKISSRVCAGEIFTVCTESPYIIQEIHLQILYYIYFTGHSSSENEEYKKRLPKKFRLKNRKTGGKF